MDHRGHRKTTELSQGFTETLIFGPRRPISIGARVVGNRKGVRVARRRRHLRCLGPAREFDTAHRHHTILKPRGFNQRLVVGKLIMLGGHHDLGPLGYKCPQAFLCTQRRIIAQSGMNMQICRHPAGHLDLLFKHRPGGKGLFSLTDLDLKLGVAPLKTPSQEHPIAARRQPNLQGIQRGSRQRNRRGFTASGQVLSPQTKIRPVSAKNRVRSGINALEYEANGLPDGQSHATGARQQKRG